MRNTIVKRLAAVITVSTLLVAVPGTAFGQTEPVERSIAEADRSQTRIIQRLELSRVCRSDCTFQFSERGPCRFKRDLLGKDIENKTGKTRWMSPEWRVSPFRQGTGQIRVP